MMYKIRRSEKEIDIGVGERGEDAGRLGFTFVQKHLHLIRLGWKLSFHRTVSVASVESGPLPDNGCTAALLLADLIKAGAPPPPAPKHDCPSCECKMECCN